MKLKFLILIILMSVFSVKAQENNVFDVARNGTVEEMKALLKKNPEIINTPNEMGFSPLILACYRGNVAVAEFLIENVRDINYKSPEGTALAGLCIRYNKELVQALLRKKADPNIADANGTTPLIWAVKTGNEELVRLLLENNAVRDQPDHIGIKPFEYAVQTQKANIINLLKTK